MVDGSVAAVVTPGIGEQVVGDELRGVGDGGGAVVALVKDATGQGDVEDIADFVHGERLWIGPKDEAVGDAERGGVQGEVLAREVGVGAGEGPGATVSAALQRDGVPGRPFRPPVQSRVQRDGPGVRVLWPPLHGTEHLHGEEAGTGPRDHVVGHILSPAAVVRVDQHAVRIAHTGLLHGRVEQPAPVADAADVGGIVVAHEDLNRPPQPSARGYVAAARPPQTQVIEGLVHVCGLGRGVREPDTAHPGQHGAVLGQGVV
ncbi:MAG: hypothetical protein BWY79_02102 [Actinobacteria bacterium ADurb.Bin444]|nr:MAG: hypothetical protein BWY79_02102 [Actinobacteria bacterium ADurb.Bin444]